MVWRRITARRGLQKSAAWYAILLCAGAVPGVVLYYGVMLFMYPRVSALCLNDPAAAGSAAQTQECTDAANKFSAVLGLAVLMMVCGVFIVHMLGAATRTSLRKRFGIPGTKVGDACTWLCCSCCAIAQEYRTMRENNVDAGVWHGKAAAHVYEDSQTYLEPPTPQSVA